MQRQSGIETLQALAVDAPQAVDAVDPAAQGPAGADFFNRHPALDLDCQLFSPQGSGALPLEQLFVFENYGGVEHGYGK